MLINIFFADAQQHVSLENLGEARQHAALLVGQEKLWLCGLLGETDREQGVKRCSRLSVAKWRSGGIAVWWRLAWV